MGLLNWVSLSLSDTASCWQLEPQTLGGEFQSSSEEWILIATLGIEPQGFNLVRINTDSTMLNDHT